MTRASIPWNTNQIVKAFQNGSLTFDNAIQRGFVWDKKRASLLVDSILRGFTIPPIYTIRTDRKVQTPKGMVSVYDCIDGKQRCTALAKFMSDEFALEGLDTFVENGEEVDINGKKFSELSEEMQDTFKSYGMSVNYFTDITDDEVSEMMSRMNNGKALTGVENARIKALDLNTVMTLAKHPMLTENLSEAAIKGYANEDIVMKVALLSNGDTDLSSKNVRSAYESYDFSKTDYGKALTEKMNGIMTLVGKAVEDLKERVAEKTLKKKVVSKIVSKTNLVSILYAVGMFKAFTIEPDDLADTLAEFFAPMDAISINDDYNEACTNGTMHSSNVEMRNGELIACFKSAFGADNFAGAFVQADDSIGG